VGREVYDLVCLQKDSDKIITLQEPTSSVKGFLLIKEEVMLWSSLPTLVLDTSKKPDSIVPAKEALLRVLGEKAIALEERMDFPIRSQKLTMYLPSVIESFSYGGSKLVFSKLAVVYRDNQQCAYCLKYLPVDKLTVDHIIPVSKFEEAVKDPKIQNRFFKLTGLDKFPKTKTSWLNCVASCNKCNGKKGNRYPWLTNMMLVNLPFVPEYTPKIVMSYDLAEKRGWLKYLIGHNDNKIVRLIQK
jgi:5-methylcytosine-specific restriction endonuclease McrA